MTFTVAVGDELPPLSKTPDREALVKYAAGGGDFNPLHFDAEFPQAVEIGGNIVHGRLKYAALGELVASWLGPEGWVRKITAQYRGIDRLNATFTCRGTVTELREDTDAGGAPVRVASLDVWTEDAEGRKTTTGIAEVVLPVG